MFLHHEDKLFAVQVLVPNGFELCQKNYAEGFDRTQVELRDYQSKTPRDVLSSPDDVSLNGVRWPRKMLNPPPGTPPFSTKVTN